MNDKILEMFFEPQRWEYAIEKGVGKDINRAYLYQLTKEETRAQIYQLMKAGKYEIAPPHTAQIPKDTPGEFRTVYVNEPIDRIILSIANDLLFELTPERIHDSCKAYRKGIGCGMVVQQIAEHSHKVSGDMLGWKSDLSKYFDSVPIWCIDAAFNMVEDKHGKSAVIDVLRKYYHSDLYFDTDGKLQSAYQSLKQGCSVASWLADVILYETDKKLSELGYYVRYSDDMLFIGDKYLSSMAALTQELDKMDMKLNPKKVEYLERGKWFKFLGFALNLSRNKDNITLAKSRIKSFQKEIEDRTIKKHGTTFTRALNAVNRYLYKGNGEFSWATQVLPIVNVKKDLDELNKFVMDALRAVKTGKTKIGGLGFIRDGKDGCVSRGIGRNVKANRTKTGDKLDGYMTISCMANAIKTRRGVYNTLVAQL